MPDLEQYVQANPHRVLHVVQQHSVLRRAPRKFWGGFWGRLEKGACYGFYSKKGSENGSQKGFGEGGFQKVPRTPPRRVRPLESLACALLRAL